MALARMSPTFSRNISPGAAQGRVLYVEDEDANWKITERYLRGKFELKRARSSSEALSLVGTQSFDLLLLDIELAGSELDGLGLCRVFRGTAPPPQGFRRPGWLTEAVPIVFVTAYTARYPREELLRLGANEVVTKPVDYTRLLLVSSRLIVSGLHGPAT